MRVSFPSCFYGIYRSLSGVYKIPYSNTIGEEEWSFSRLPAFINMIQFSSPVHVYDGDSKLSYVWKDKVI